MDGTRPSVFLALLLVGVAFAVPEIDVARGTLFAAKRLSLRSSDPLTRRSPNSHFMRFGRTDIGGGGGGTASKVNVKREAYEPEDDDASRPRHSRASPTPSLTCVPDTDANGRVVCYSPFNVSRHFLLVTESGGGAGSEGGARAAADDVDSAEGDDDDDDDDDDGGDDDDGDNEDGGPADEGKNNARRRTVRRSMGPDSSKLRFGRSAAPEPARHVDAFARFGRRRDNFMRLGRGAGAEENPSQPLRLRGRPDAEKGFASISDGDERSSPSFARFQRVRSTSAQWRQPPQRSRTDGDDRAIETLDDDPSSRHSRERVGFARLARGPRDTNQLRFGRSSDPIGARIARRPANFMRLGRGGGGGGGDDGASADSAFFERSARRRNKPARSARSGGSGDDNGLDADLFRETRRRDSFLRLGRGRPVAAGGSRVCGLPVDLLTPRLIRRLFDDRRASNQSTDFDDRADSVAVFGYGDEGDGAATPADSNSYYDSTIECLRRYVRLPTTDSPSRMRTRTRPPFVVDSANEEPRRTAPSTRSRSDRAPSLTSGGGGGGGGGDSSQPPPVWPDSYRVYDAYKSDDDVYRIPTAAAAAAIKLRISA